TCLWDLCGRTCRLAPVSLVGLHGSRGSGLRVSRGYIEKMFAADAETPTASRPAHRGTRHSNRDVVSVRCRSWWFREPKQIRTDSRRIHVAGSASVEQPVARR